MRHLRRRATKALLGTLILITPVVAPAVTAAAPAPATEHCVVVVTGQKADGELQTTKPFCRTDRAAALGEARALAPNTFAIGIHYDLPGLAGASFTVVGDSCTGGWLDLNVAWRNRVSSTSNGCPRVRHFDGYGLTWASETTFGLGGNLTALDNRTNSIQYLP